MRDQIIADAAGRKICFRKAGVVDVLRLYKALGATLAANDSYLGLAMIAASVREVDGVPLPAPVDEASVEAALERLGDEGVAAVAAAMRPPTVDEVVAQAGN